MLPAPIEAILQKLMKSYNGSCSLGSGLMDLFNLYLYRGHTLLAKSQEGGGCAININAIC